MRYIHLNKINRVQTPLRPLPVVLLFLVLDSSKGVLENTEVGMGTETEMETWIRSSDLIVSIVRLDVVIRWKFNASVLVISKN